MTRVGGAIASWLGARWAALALAVGLSVAGLIGPVGAGTGVAQAAASGYSVWGWGQGDLGMFGNGASADAETPVQAAGVSGQGVLSDVTDLATSSNHVLALLPNGAVLAWGLGWGTDVDSVNAYYPVQVLGLGQVSQVAAGDTYSLALQSDGTVMAWGYGQQGQLGVGEYEDSPAPVEVESYTGQLDSQLHDIAAIAAGGWTSLALNTYGGLYAWGFGQQGQLGGGADGNGDYPEPVEDTTGDGYLSGVTAIAAGDNHELALLSDHEVVAWGDDSDGQLGDDGDSGGSSDLPVHVQQTGGGSALTGVTAIAAGDRFSLALLSNGTVDAWGSNQYEQLGQSSLVPNAYYPVQVSGLSDVVAIAASESDSYALEANGTLWAWGDNEFGELGTGSSVDETDQPVEVADLGDGVVALAADADLRGELVLAQPVPSLGGSTLGFGTQAQDTIGAAHSLTVTNAGAPGLTAEPVLSGTDADDFLPSGGSCVGLSLATGASCTLDFRFAPSASTGANETATVTIDTNGSANPQVTLSGTAGSLPQGPAGPRGPAGKVELVSCKTVTKTVKHHKVKVKQCTTKLVSGTVKFTTGVARAKLTRNGRVYASGTSAARGHGRSQLLLVPRRRLRPGVYTLTISSRHGRRRVTRHVRVVVG